MICIVFLTYAYIDSVHNHSKLFYLFVYIGLVIPGMQNFAINDPFVYIPLQQLNLSATYNSVDCRLST